jgi:hypothetical protein
MMIYRVASLLFFSSLSLAAYGGDVYKWTDDKGQIHYGDSIPERYAQKSKEVKLQGLDLSTAQRREAEARPARERADGLSISVREEKANGTSSRSLSLPESPRARGDESKCRAEMRKYLESDACFARYRLANGGIKQEAYRYCTEVLQPKC